MYNLRQTMVDTKYLAYL